MTNQITDALQSIMASVPTATAEMVHKQYTARVLVPSTNQKSVETFDGVEPFESARVITPRVNFPDLKAGEVITLAGQLRIVISVDVDAIGATLRAALSESFADLFDNVVEIYGAKTRGTFKCAFRTVGYSTAPVSELSLESTVMENRIIVPKIYWTFSHSPNIGDKIINRAANYSGRIAAIDNWTDACYVLTCEES